MRSTLSKAAALAIAALFASSFAPSVAADSLAPPSELTATPSGDGMVLSWSPPEGESPDGYRVYLDGTLVATPVDTSLWVPTATRYAVTAFYETDTGGSQSMAAVIVAPTAQPAGEWCDPMPTTINTSEPPFVDPRPQPHCVGVIVWRLIEEILQG